MWLDVARLDDAAFHGAEVDVEVRVFQGLRPGRPLLCGRCAMRGE